MSSPKPVVQSRASSSAPLQRSEYFAPANHIHLRRNRIAVAVLTSSCSQKLHYVHCFIDLLVQTVSNRSTLSVAVCSAESHQQGPSYTGKQGFPPHFRVAYMKQHLSTCPGSSSLRPTTFLPILELPSSLAFAPESLFLSSVDIPPK